MKQDGADLEPGRDDLSWHALEAAEVLVRLNSDERAGLAPEEAARRLRHHGPNQLPAPRRRPAWLRFVRQFNNVLIYIMLAAAVVTLLLGHWIDSGVLIAAVFVNSIIGFIQEGKAENALDAIRGMLSLHAIVYRGGERMDVSARDLVPGDIVVLASGDKVPADLRILGGRNLRVDEALLTGESVAASKTPAATDPDIPLGDRRSMLYSGSIVQSGQASGVVVATGQRTELGRISVMLEEVESVSTPLIRQIAGFSRWLAAAILMLSALTFAIGFLWRGHGASDMFMMVVALAASAIPEGLPAILTATLALGVQRMARRKAIIRKLHAVETLGAVTVICSDKTGTLTRNEMTVQRLVTAARSFQIGGVGYVPKGAFELSGKPCSPADDPDVKEALRAAALCNDAVLRQEDAGWAIVGDPTEGALVVLGRKAGLDSAAVRRDWPRKDVIPFESEHRFMATLHHEPCEPGGTDGDIGGVIYIKGAPERVLEMCATQCQNGRVQPLDSDYWRRQAADCAARGMRLLSIAVKRVAPKDELAFADIEGGCSMLALVGIIDPPREEAIAAVAACHAAGVRVKMITGDHVDTARAIGAQLSIGQNRPALTGAEIELLDDVSLRDVVADVDIYARASPEHKLRLVQALQARNEVVAMTGDGVNDAPALKRADIGVAMGRKGTDAAKDAADMVLTDDNFATITDAVRSGRGVYDNIRKFILFMLPTNGGEGMVVVAAILFDLVLPLLAVQVLWINMVTSSTLGLALAFERTEADVMQRPPRNPRESLLTPFFVWRITMVSVLMMIGALGLFLWKLEQGASVETARTMAVNAVVFSEMFYLFNSRYIYDSVLSRQGLLGNPYVLGAVVLCLGLQVAFTHAAPLQRIFGSTGLTATEWMGVVGAGAFVFVVAEFEKFVQRRLAARRRLRGAEGGIRAAARNA